ncbi:hypothetical protein [Porphyromonas loveana]|uniref:hypothetical protein n=1 Tax=Porphyromonas loveana TaxID=1884669 RepID=UPI00359FA68E
MAHTSQNYGAKTVEIWHRFSSTTRAKSFLIWRIFFLETAPKSFLFGAHFLGNPGVLEIVTLLHTFSDEMICSLHASSFSASMAGITSTKKEKDYLC